MEPPQNETLSSLLTEMADAEPDKTVAIDQSTSVTYGALERRADELAAGFHDLGIGRGDHVAILMENRVEWLESLFALLRLGAIVVGVNTWATEREIAYYLDHSDATAVVATAAFAGTDYAATLDAILDYQSTPVGGTSSDSAPSLETVVLLGAEQPGAVQYESVPAAPGIEFTTDPNDPSDVYSVLYTSGSTSKPKGVQLCHGDGIENAFHIGERMHLTPADRIWLSSPLFWSYGVANALVAALSHRGSVVLQSPFDPETAVELIDEHDCTVYYGMPNMARDIVDADNFEPGRVRFRTGTTIGQPEDIAFTIDELGVEELANIYGSTETYGNCAVTDCSLPRETRLRTQGEPLPGQDVVVADPDSGDRLPQGEVGELRVKGRITPGYYYDPEQTADAFDGQDYFKTGDLGRLDESGRVQFRGRLKNMIKTSGINVSPVEVEEFLLEHDDVDQAYVVGLPDERRDEIVAAVIVPKKRATLSETELAEHCEDLAGYKRPRAFAITTAEALPETDTGKIKKNRLDEFFDRS